MKEKIPENTITTCDVCHRTDSVASFKTTAVLEIKHSSLDFQGCPVGPGGLSLDLCDSCVSSLEQLIRDAQSRQSFVRAGGGL